MSETSITETPVEPEAKPTHQEKAQLPQHIGIFFLGGFILSGAIDFLFWQKSFGYSYAIWVGLVLVVSLLLALREKKEVHPEAYFFIAALIATTGAAVLRMESGTRAYNVLASLFLIGLTCDTLITGGALRFRVVDAFVRLLLLVFAAFERPIQAFIAAGENKQRGTGKAAWRTPVTPILRGTLIAIPILVVFSALFAAADPIFEQALADFFEWIKIENWAEFVWRGFYISILGLLFSGLLLHALSAKRNYTAKPEQPLIQPFLGKIETFTILALIEALFAAFIFIQFRYFFGGENNISAAGYTFAEYARKGTNELITVAILALLVYQVLHLVTKTPHKRDRLILHILITVLFLEVLVMLFSSYQRVGLYQAAYGFSRIRIRTTIFIGWLAALLFLVVVLEWLGKSNRFFAVLLFISLGFILSQAAVNIDQTIVERNLARLRQELPSFAEEGFDHNYLPQLSMDIVPAVLAAADGGKIDDLTTEMLYAELHCRQQKLRAEFVDNQTPWFSKNPAEVRAWKLLQDRQNLVPETAIDFEGGTYNQYYYSIELSNGEIHYCDNYWRGWD